MKWTVIGLLAGTLAHPVERALSTSPGYMGCYTDHAQRTLTGPEKDLANNSPASCTAFCASQGYAYAGMEYSYQVGSLMRWTSLDVADGSAFAATRSARPSCPTPAATWPATATPARPAAAGSP